MSQFQDAGPNERSVFLDVLELLIALLPPGETIEGFCLEKSTTAVDQLAQICPNTSSIH